MKEDYLYSSIYNDYYLDKSNKLSIYNEDNELLTEMILKHKINVFKVHEVTNEIYFMSDNNEYVYVLDSKLNLKKKIKLEKNNYFGKIINISFCKNKLVLITKNKVLLFTLKGKFIKVIYELSKKRNNPCQERLGSNFDIELIDAICCNDDIFIAYKDSNCYYIAKLINNTLNVVYKTNNKILRLFIKDDYLFIIVIIKNKKECLCTGIECNCNKFSCNSCDITSSIAQIESCLAKILCAEAFKIKAAIRNTKDNEELLKINESVSKLIYKVSILEFILTEKLALTKNKNLF